MRGIDPRKEAAIATIEDYRFGHIVIDGEELTKDLIILPDRVVRDWWRIDGHNLSLEDLEQVIEQLPARLIVGSGAEGRMRVDPFVLEALEGRGVDVEVWETPTAVERYQESDSTSTAAALHLTC